MGKRMRKRVEWRKDSEGSQKDGGVNSQKKKSNKWLRTGSDVRWREEE